MLNATSGLTATQLADIAALETRVVAHDGGRLKLAWGTLRERSADRVEDVLWHADDGTLVGFVGLYRFGGGPYELAGMVDPDHRRRGIGRALVGAAVQLLAARDEATTLLVTPRSTPAGAAFAAALGAALHHSEHAMTLHGTPPSRAENPDIALRDATPGDLPVVADLLLDGFGFGLPADSGLEPGTQVIERRGQIIGTLAVNRLDDQAAIYGFVVSNGLRGQGIGRDILTRVCRSLRAEGVTTVGLEVEVANDNALGLYESVGFVRAITEDYFSLRVPAVRG